VSKHKPRKGLVGWLLSQGFLTRLWGRVPLPLWARNLIVWLLNPKYTVGVIALVRDEEGRILLLKHTYRPGWPWGLPGGGLRAGETLEECLRREVREEAGLQIEVDELLSAAARTDRKLIDLIFACHPLPGQTLATFKPNAEVEEARFVSPDDLPAEVSDGQRRLISVALRQAAGDRRIPFQPLPREMP
jgi:8-oxo-dGTP diphosphatase